MPEAAPPDAEAQAHSARLRAVIQEQIFAGGGAIAFSRFMELCLYAPGLGYYSAGAARFGAAGDFVTAPELGSLFAACVADALAPVVQQLGPGADFVELGGGSGAFAAAALMQLQSLQALPARYAILEPSADLRQRQRERLQRQLPPALFARVAWLEGPPSQPWSGVLFANEVIDALPTPRFTLRDGTVLEEWVALDGAGHFIRSDRRADALLTAAVRQVERQLPAPFADGYRSELLPQLPYWLQAVIGEMRDGALLFVDYGYPRREYYQPQRRDGTLRAFRRHRMSGDAYAWPGLQDLTASVEFTALAEAGVGAGFDFTGYCAQASFLIGNGLARNLAAAEADARDPAACYALRQEAKRLTLPESMGERFQAIGFQRGVEFGAAFRAGDLGWRL